MDKIISFTKILMIGLFVWSLQLSVLTAGVGSVPILPGDYNSDRDETNGVSTNLDSFYVGWNITPNMGLIQYHYRFVVPEDAADDFFGVFIEVSDDFTLSDISNVQINGEEADEEDWKLNALDYGLHFANVTDGSYDHIIDIIFDSTRVPVYGDFTIDSNNYAYNTGIGTGPTSPFIDWIATPNSEVIIPEPMTMLLLGSSLGTIAGWKKRRKK